MSWGLRGHAGSQEPDAAVKGGVKTTFQCEAELRVWRNNGGRFLLESKPAASCDSGRAKQADGTVGFTWTLWGGGCLLIRCPITVAKESRAKTMWDPEVMMATHLRKPRPLPRLSHQQLRLCFSTGPTFSTEKSNCGFLGNLSGKVENYCCYKQFTVNCL